MPIKIDLLNNLLYIYISSVFAEKQSQQHFFPLTCPGGLLQYFRNETQSVTSSHGCSKGKRYMQKSLYTSIGFFFKNWRKATSNISMKGRRSVKAKNRMYKTGTVGLLVKSSLSGAFFLSPLFFIPFVFHQLR